MLTQAGGADTLSAMRLAAIDVGTNSVHMVIADVDHDGRMTVVDRIRETVGLGHRVFVTGRLAEEPMDLAVRALDNFARFIGRHRVERVRAVATCAVREADNREDFIRRIRRETGIRAEVISGVEEARLVFIAARHAMGLRGGPCLLVDVGGGSVQLVLVADGEPLWMRSFGIGISRVSDRFLRHDPPHPREVREAEAYLKDAMYPPLLDARRHGVERAVGTSGTINAMVAMASVARGDEMGRLHGASASAAEIAQLKSKVLTRTVAERTRLAGMEPRRADQMPAAAILAGHVLRHSRAPQLVACTWGLREGLLLELAGLAGRRSIAEVRRHSVEALATKFQGTNIHGRTVAKLAQQLFEATAPALRLPVTSRELLEYAALLHDIGHVVGHERHHRHSYYLIRNAELLGFDPDEIEAIGQAACGHRGQSARLDLPELRPLPAAKQRLVRAMAAIVRVADALDRSHAGMVRNIKVSTSANHLTIVIDAARDKAGLELWACGKKTSLLSKLLGRPVLVRQATTRRGPQRTSKFERA